MTRGLILILHSGFTKINIDDCLAALPAEMKSLNHKSIEVTYSDKVDLHNLYNLNFGQCALEHRRQFEAEIKPILDTYSDYQILYFGMAPIPLAIDFGHLFHNYRKVEAYQFHHVSKEWHQESSTAVETNNLVVENLPDIHQKGIASTLIRLSISHMVAPESTSEVLSNAAEVNIYLEKPGEDAIASKHQMTEIAEKIKDTLDQLSNNRSGIKEIHLFASIPCGLAFLVGTKISPTIHPYIQTYQFSKTETPVYKKAIRVKAGVEASRVIGDKEKEEIEPLRKITETELTQHIKDFCFENEEMSKGRAWYIGLIPRLEEKVMRSDFWQNIPALYETSLQNDSFSTETDAILDGFMWKLNKWYIDDGFFVSVKKRIPSEDQIRQAIRLFLFHESLHYKKHNLNDATAANIGSFPKVLETADYQADVYGLLNEYAFSKVSDIDSKEFFLNAIITATETMWSFDDAGVNLEQIQIRRLNRYLIWYWQHAMIERFGSSITEIIKILENKPVIELNGLKSKEENNRYYYLLDEPTISQLELGVFHNNKIIRKGSATNMSLETLVNGVKEMNGQKVLNVIRGFIED